MMFRKWMIGACIAVAVGGAAAEAQSVEMSGHGAVPIDIRNHGPRSYKVRLYVPEDEVAGAAVKSKTSKHFEQVVVAPYSQARLTHESVSETPKHGTRKHILEVKDAKTGRVLYRKVLSMSKPAKKLVAGGYAVLIREDVVAYVRASWVPGTAPGGGIDVP